MCGCRAEVSVFGKNWTARFAVVSKIVGNTSISYQNGTKLVTHIVEIDQLFESEPPI